MNFRLKTAAGPVVLKDIPNDNLFANLQSEILKATGIAPERQKIKFGFPPKELSEESSSGLKSGETLIVEEKASGTSAQKTHSSQPTPIQATSAVVHQSQQQTSQSINTQIMAPVVAPQLHDDGPRVVRR
eukprot:Colp12_sorted_trinity150504_noHs@20021